MQVVSVVTLEKELSGTVHRRHVQAGDGKVFALPFAQLAQVQLMAGTTLCQPGSTNRSRVTSICLLYQSLAAISCILMRFGLGTRKPGLPSRGQLLHLRQVTFFLLPAGLQKL